ncbi:MGMT family protein [Brooklawnia cerclae]
MDDLVSRVRTAVSAIPTGTIATYGDVAELVGCHARQVGRIMAAEGADLPWWRVTNVRGELPAHLLPAARARWDDEGIPFVPDAPGARIASCRADPSAWVARLPREFPTGG